MLSDSLGNLASCDANIKGILPQQSNSQKGSAHKKAFKKECKLASVNRCRALGYAACPKHRLLDPSFPCPFLLLQHLPQSLWQRQKSDLKKFRAISQVIVLTLESLFLAVLVWSVKSGFSSVVSEYRCVNSSAAVKQCFVILHNVCFSLLNCSENRTQFTGRDSNSKLLMGSLLLLPLSCHPVQVYNYRWDLDSAGSQ